MASTSKYLEKTPTESPKGKHCHQIPEEHLRALGGDVHHRVPDTVLVLWFCVPLINVGAKDQSSLFDETESVKTV